MAMSLALIANTSGLWRVSRKTGCRNTHTVHDDVPSRSGSVCLPTCAQGRH